jgi:hypothetical protein
MITGRKMKKLIRKIGITVLALSLSIGSVYAGEVDAIDNDDSKELLSIAKDSMYNVMLFDEEGKILNEFHVDGTEVDYSYSKNKELLKVSCSNGISVELSYQKDSTIELKKYSGEELIDTGKIEKADDNRKSIDKVERNKLLTVAAEGTLSFVKDIAFYNSSKSDTYLNGYNLSTMCPSVWTAAMGTDKFARPSTALTESQIQAFLESKNSVLQYDVHVWAKNSSGVVYDTGRVVTPSEIIDDACRDSIINPKVILGSLQREQGLISKTTVDESSRSMYFCMGYGATDGGDYNNLSGFDNQIVNGTELYADLWYEGFQKGQNGFPLTFSALDGSVQINNCGTYALFKYTPWKSSNKLFLDIMDGYWPQSSGVNGINWN